MDKLLYWIFKEKRWWAVAVMGLLAFFYIIKEPLIAWIDYKKATYREPEAEVRYMDHDIMVELRADMDGLGADRGYIFLFDNNTGWTGKGEEYFSCEYEVVKDGVSKEKDNLQHLSTNMFSWWLEEVTYGNMFYNDIEFMEDYTTREVLQSQGIRGIMCVPMWDGGRVVGVVGFDFNSRPTIDLTQPGMQSFMSKRGAMYGKFFIK